MHEIRVKHHDIIRNRFGSRHRRKVLAPGSMSHARERSLPAWAPPPGGIACSDSDAEDNYKSMDAEAAARELSDYII
eukprot:8412659-Pyramimonas_sp.AAC.1